MSKHTEQPTEVEEAPSEHPVLGHEPLYVPKGVTLTDILARLDAVEAEVAELKGSQTTHKSSAPISSKAKT